MNDYGEILKLPYKMNNIYGPIKYILKNDNIKFLKFQSIDEKNKIINLIYKKLLIKYKVNVSISEIENEGTIIEITSKSKLFGLKTNRKIVEEIITAILDEIKNYEKLSDDWIYEPIKIDNKFKKILQIIILLIGWYYICSWIIIFFVSEFLEKLKNNSNWLLLPLFLSLFVTIVYILISKKIKKTYSLKREASIKEELHNVIEKQKKDISSNDVKQTKKTDYYEVLEKITLKVKAFFKTILNFIKKIYKEKPKTFCFIIIMLSLLTAWAVFISIESPCEYNIKMGGYQVTKVTWCRTDIIMDSKRLPEGFDVTKEDFVYCNYETTDSGLGWAEGFVYKACAKEKGWEENK